MGINLNTLMENDREKALQHVEKNIYYDDSVNAWVVSDNKIASHILKNENFTANRKKDYIQSLDISKNQKELLTEFYGNWLMYMSEDDHHIHVKRQVQRAVNHSISRIIKGSKTTAQQKMKNTQCYIDVVNEISHPFTVQFLSSFYGITKHDYLFLQKIGQPIIQFIFTDDIKVNIEDVVASIHEARDYMNLIIKNENYNQSGFLGYILNETGTTLHSIDIILNMMIDGHAPFNSSINHLVYYYLTASHSNRTNKEIVLDSLRNYPPFPYIRRVCTKDTTIENNEIKVGDHILMLIFIGNRNKEDKSLTFGHGIHYCLGVMIVTLALESFLKEFKKNYSTFKLQTCHWHTTFGFQELSKLNIKKAD